MKDKSRRRILKYISLVLLGVFVFNLGLNLGILLINKQSSQSYSTTLPRNDKNIMEDQQFVDDLSKALVDQAKVEYYQNSNVVYVIPTDEGLINLLDSLVENDKNLDQWQIISDSFVELSNYTNLNIYFVNPHNQANMLLWVVNGSVKYNFIDDLNHNQNPKSINTLLK